MNPKSAKFHDELLKLCMKHGAKLTLGSRPSFRGRGILLPIDQIASDIEDWREVLRDWESLRLFRESERTGRMWLMGERRWVHSLSSARILWMGQMPLARKLVAQARRRPRGRGFRYGAIDEKGNDVALY